MNEPDITTEYLITHPLSEAGDKERLRNQYSTIIFAARHEYKAWVEGMAVLTGLNRTQLLVKALDEFAKRWGYPPAPKRTKLGPKPRKQPEEE